MAQNFINYFETENLYNTEKFYLGNPSVSFVKETGAVYYSKYEYGLNGTRFGDIILEDSTKLYSVTPDEYNLTDFPTNTYTPIGICIKPVTNDIDYLTCIYLKQTDNAYSGWMAGGTDGYENYRNYLNCLQTICGSDYNTADFTKGQELNEYLNEHYQLYNMDNYRTPSSWWNTAGNFVNQLEIYSKTTKVLKQGDMFPAMKPNLDFINSDNIDMLFNAGSIIKQVANVSNIFDTVNNKNFVTAQPTSYNVTNQSVVYKYTYTSNNQTYSQTTQTISGPNQVWFTPVFSIKHTV